MHIPDGYLSPATCAGLYGAAAPFWYVALRRVKRVLNARTAPLLALFSAFSFVVMMFNLPLPGGTTGHAVGMAMASIVLGPWVSILAISMALSIQALFFGDGGITTFGANCFNMAIVGSLVAYGTYRLLSARSDIASPRRVLAAGLAGYAAVNAAAFCAAIEFGVQPIFFHDASGTPLYAPYPLSISIPAMMIGHLTLAGLAEFVLTAGLVRFLQRTDPQLLQRTAAQAHPEGIFAKRKLWAALGTALLLTPIGILAIGRAWGEWSPQDLATGTIRQQIATASHGVFPPVRAPAGLQHLSQLWSAPLASYTPRFVTNASLGYFVSALIGVGLIVIFIYALAWAAAKRGRRGRSFTERTLATVLGTLEGCFFADEVSQADGFLQRIDPRAKIIGLGVLIVAAVVTHGMPSLIAIFASAVVLAGASRISPRVLFSRVWIPVLAFTGAIVLPSLFLIPGKPLFRIPLLHWTVTERGLTGASFLLLRAETAATFSLLLVLCTPWNRLLRALRFFRVPGIVVFTIEMSHRYIFLLLKTLRDMLESRETRRIGQLPPKDERRIAASSAAVLLDKSLKLSEEVYCAMRARGFQGEVYILDELRLKVTDSLQMSLLVVVACLAIWWGR